METIFEKSQAGHKAWSLPKASEKWTNFSPPTELLRDGLPPLPEISEIDLTRHFNALAERNVGVDTQFYPLGSCTMKLNPRINEQAAALPGFTRTHPLAPEETVQGNLQLIDELINDLCAFCGMASGTVVPNAGAQGEFTGLRMIQAYHKHRNDPDRNEILVPDDAHGTNPASAAMAGFKTIAIPTDSSGDLDIAYLKKAVSKRTAGLMLTNPNTLGLFSNKITEIAEIVHHAGGLLYYDGANLNAILNVTKPGDMGFDVMHINLHKTFSTPHGGGGPGSGPVLCQEKLKPFLPVPRVIKENDHYHLQWEAETSIGHMATFHGNFGICLRAYLYIKLHGQWGLRKIAEQAVLNANYLKKRLEKFFTIPFKKPCMHEFVVQADNYLDQGIRAYDIAKRMLDYQVHAPTVYFPLIIKECFLIEPTESESKRTLDQFVAIIEAIVNEIKTSPELVKSAPHTKPVSRLDEVMAAKHPILKSPFKE